MDAAPRVAPRGTRRSPCSCATEYQETEVSSIPPLAAALKESLDQKDSLSACALLQKLEMISLDEHLILSCGIPALLAECVNCGVADSAALERIAALTEQVKIDSCFVDPGFLQKLGEHTNDETSRITCLTIWKNVLRTDNECVRKIFMEMIPLELLRETSETGDVQTVLSVMGVLKSVVKNGVSPEYGCHVLELLRGLRPVSNDILIEPIFWVLFYLMKNDSVTYESVYKHGFVQMIQSALMDTTESAAIAACHLIGLLYRKYEFRYRFNLERVLTVMITERESGTYSDSICTASMGALSAMVTRLPVIVERLVEDNIIEMLVQVFRDRSVATKVSFLALFDALLVSSGELVCEHILDEYEPGRETILTVIANVADTHQNTVVVRCFKIVSRMFEIIASINRGREFVEMFTEAFTTEQLEKLRTLVPEIAPSLEAIMRHSC